MVEAGLVVAVLADEVAVEVRLRGVVGNRGAGIIELFDDVVLDRISQEVFAHC